MTQLETALMKAEMMMRIGDSLTAKANKLEKSEETHATAIMFHDAAALKYIQARAVIDDALNV